MNSILQGAVCPSAALTSCWCIAWESLHSRTQLVCMSTYVCRNGAIKSDGNEYQINLCTDATATHTHKQYNIYVCIYSDIASGNTKIEGFIL